MQVGPCYLMSARDVQTVVTNLCFLTEGTGFAWGRNEVLSMCLSEAQGYMDLFDARVRTMNRTRK